MAIAFVNWPVITVSSLRATGNLHIETTGSKIWILSSRQNEGVAIPGQALRTATLFNKSIERRINYLLYRL